MENNNKNLMEELDNDTNFDFKEYLADLSEDEYNYGIGGIPKNPFLIRIENLRREGLRKRTMENKKRGLIELLDSVCEDDDYKKFLSYLTKEEWDYIVEQLPKNPYLGKLEDLRIEGLKEKNEIYYKYAIKTYLSAKSLYETNNPGDYISLIGHIKNFLIYIISWQMNNKTDLNIDANEYLYPTGFVLLVYIADRNNIDISIDDYLRKPIFIMKYEDKVYYKNKNNYDISKEEIDELMEHIDTYYKKVINN